uniref:G-protein coupled receptors family 2 profile 2 domain-containing protein n=1 Tax=Plectus sambesii TaxID=2011161 RepID=A0A914WMZ3_9BILA
MTGSIPCEGAISRADNAWEVCESEACPHWGEWEEWGYCKSTCFPDRFSGVRSRKRECVKDEKHTALCDISHVDADNNTCGPTYDSCMMQNGTCSVIMNQCGPVTAPVVTVAVATIQYAVNLVGSLCIIGVCAFLIAVFSLVKGLSVHRILHALEELSLILGHLCLCFMGEAVKEESSCELVTIAVNWAFLVYFTLLTIECFHVMTFIGHIIRCGAIIHPAILYAIGLLFPVVISIIMWACFGDKMIVTIAGVRRLCWIDTCQDEDTNCASLDNYAARMFFCIYACLCCASVVFVECGHSLSRIYPYRLYGTDLMLLRDAQFAHNGLYIMITVSYLAFACSIAAFQYQARDPHNALVYVWSTAATCLDVVLAFILLFYHSFGNAKVRRVIGNILRCSYCSRTRYKQNNDRNIPSSTLTD